VESFRRGLGETGFIEGRNVAIEFRWAEGQYDRLPALAADLVRRRVAVIVATGGPGPGQAAKAATATIPIVFNSGADPVREGLVASFNRPGGNATGVNVLLSALEGKRLGLLREMVPNAALIAVLLNPAMPTFDDQVNDVQPAPWGSDCTFCVQATTARSMLPSRRRRSCGRAHCSSAPTRSCSPGANVC
jgi:putative ABC transport system substrate-binding protein